MTNSIDSQVSEVRKVSRLLVRELGFMSRNVAGTELSPSAVHTIVEIGGHQAITASDLSTLLLLEKSTVSRLMKSLVKKDLVTEKAVEFDARAKYFLLTKKGKKVLKTINDYAENRVSMAIEPLEGNARRSILKGLRTFSSALKNARLKQ